MKDQCKGYEYREKAFLFETQPSAGFICVGYDGGRKKYNTSRCCLLEAHVDDGTVIVPGPVMDPKGGYGIAVVAVDSEEQINRLIVKDPANGLNSYDIYPMRAVTNQG